MKQVLLNLHRKQLRPIFINNNSIIHGNKKNNKYRQKSNYQLKIAKCSSHLNRKLFSENIIYIKFKVSKNVEIGFKASGTFGHFRLTRKNIGDMTNEIKF